MQRLFAVLLMCAVALLGTAPSMLAPSALAQQAANPLPSAEALGPGWIEIPDTRPIGGPDYPEAYGWYAGPAGSRVMLFEGMPHARIADAIWQDVAQTIDADDSLRRRGHFPANTPPIAGCEDVRRVEDDDATFPVLQEATTACRTTDTIVRARISGTWQELTGVAASDALVQLVLETKKRSAPGAPRSSAAEIAPLASRSLQDLMLLFPGSGQLPSGLVLAEEGARTASEIAAAFPDPDDAAQVLDAWGWSGNAYRVYVASADAGRDTPTRLEISLHQFSTSSTVGCAECGASYALSYFAHGRAAMLDRVERLAPGMRPCEAELSAEFGEEVTRYLRYGNLLIRVTVAMPKGHRASAYYFTMPAAYATAEAVMENAGGSVRELAQTCQ